MTPEASLNRWLEIHITEFDAAMLDIDGVLLNGKNRTPGSRRLLGLLDQHRMPFILLTNDGNHSTFEKADRLNDAGLNVPPEQIVSCGHAIRTAVESLKLSGERFFIMAQIANQSMTLVRRLFPAGRKPCIPGSWHGFCSTP